MNAKRIIITSMALASLTVVSSIYADDTNTDTTTDTGTVVTTTSDETTTDTGTTMETTSTGETNTTTSDTGSVVGGDSDEHGCIGSAGYVWSGALNECVRPWETSTGAMLNEEIKKNRMQIEANWSAFHEEYGFMKDYLAKPANREEAKKIAAALKVEIKAYHDAIKAIIAEGRKAIKDNTFDKDVFNAKVKEAFATHTEALLKYVDSTKTEAFVAFMTAKEATIESNKELRIENGEIKQEIKKEKKRLLTEKQRVALKKKLEKRSRTFYSNLIKKIDAAVSKTNNEALKTKLEELKELTQEQLDAAE